MVVVIKQGGKRLEIIYSLLKWVLDLNIVILLLFTYELGKMTKNYIKQKKHGGQKVEEFYHKSGLKIFTVILLILGTMFNYWALRWGSILNTVIFQLYLCIIVIETWEKIVVYEKGIYHMGRFVGWEEIKSIKTGESSVRIEIKGSLFRMLVMDKVSRIPELIRLIEENT